MRKIIVLLTLLVFVAPAFAQTTTDNFGRTVVQSGSTYSVTDPKDGTHFTVSGVSPVRAMDVINSMQPAWYVPPATVKPSDQKGQ
jgi:hypothetical protein